MLDGVRKYRFHISLLVLCIYYAVGIVLLLRSGENNELIELTPFTISFTTFILLLNHESWSRKIVTSLVVITLLGLGIEIIGVNFGVPFGEYGYSHILGVKWWDTPIIMGINWLMLVYSGVLTVHQFISNPWIKAFISGLLLVSLDLLIEPVAIKWNMWSWLKPEVPIENFITWGCAAILFSLILSFNIGKETKNKMATPVILLQFLFFILLGLW